MSFMDALMGKKNNTQYILSKLNECRNFDQESKVLNSLLDGPKFMVTFRNVEDAKRLTEKLPYLNRNGTITYIRPISDGSYVFTGGKITDAEALQVFNAIRRPGSGQTGSTFTGWNPPGY